MVWFEASVRGVKTLGYEPNPGELAVLKREREARLVNRIEPAREASCGTAAAPAETASARGSGGRKAVLAAIEAVLVAKEGPEKQRAAMMAAATEKRAQRIGDRQPPKSKVGTSKASPNDQLPRNGRLRRPRVSMRAGFSLRPQPDIEPAAACSGRQRQSGFAAGRAHCHRATMRSRIGSMT